MRYPALTALAGLEGMSTGQQRGVICALARVQPSLLVEIAQRRQGLPVEIQADLVRQVPDFLLGRVMMALPWSGDLLDVAVETHGATTDLVVLCAAREQYATAVELAERVTPSDAVNLTYQWDRAFDKPVPQDLRAALIRAVLGHSEPVPDFSAMTQWERKRAREELRAAIDLRDSRVWQLLEPEPQLWLDLAQDHEHGHTVQRVLLRHAGELPDAVLVACLPEITGEELRMPDPDDLLAGIRLVHTAGWVKRRPRIRELAAEHLDRVVQEVVDGGWTPAGSRHIGPDWNEIAAFAELGKDPARLAAAAAVLGGAQPSTYAKSDRQRLSEWHQQRAHAVTALASNPCLPRDAILAVLPSLDEQALEMLRPHLIWTCCRAGDIVDH
jgi:hypothetical protein